MPPKNQRRPAPAAGAGKKRPTSATAAPGDDDTNNGSNSVAQNQKPFIGFLPPGARPAGGNGNGGSKKSSMGEKSGKQQNAAAPDCDINFNDYKGDDCFGYRFEEGFHVPKRLFNVPRSLVEAVNDFHFAMMNDTPRNQFYYDLLKSYVTPETGVLEIGAGSGLLSMMAARLGAKWVVAVEGSPEMAQLARQNIRANNLQDRIVVLNMLSTELTLRHLPERPHVMVSEIFGTMLLGESALDYIADVRERVLRPDTKIIPQLGVQYAVPIECAVMDQVCSVGSWNGFDLSQVMAVKDTTSLVFTKQYGFRLSSVPFTFLSEPVPILDIDFATTTRKSIKQRFPVRVNATETGTANAWLFYFVAKDFLKPTTPATATTTESADGLVAAEEDERQMLFMSTNPKDTIDNFPRDMQWGQALQLIDTDRGRQMPEALTMEAGKEYAFECHFSYDRVVVEMNFTDGPADMGTFTATAVASNEAAKAKETD